MIDIEGVYFEWLLTRLNPDGVLEGVAYTCDLLHDYIFERRVGNDINRAANGADLRKQFLEQFEPAEFDPHVTNHLMMQECSWLEMLVALCVSLDYMYEGGVENRFIEIIENVGLGSLLDENPNRSSNVITFERGQVESVLHKIDENRFDSDGNGGLFPLASPNHPDQRYVEIWDQQAAYFREKFRGVLWTSTS